MRETYDCLRTAAVRNPQHDLGSMADSAIRLLRLLGLLQRRPLWHGNDLADHLEVEPRTVRRDVERLRALGYQVEGIAGASGGYRLVGGNDIPPLVFEDDEAMAVAVVLGVSAGAAVPGIERGALSALAKLDRLLPARLRRPVATLRSATVSLAPSTEPVSPDSLLLLATACESCQRATFSYRTKEAVESARRVEPHRLVATDQRWYLVAYDLDRDDWRTFRVDRASDVAVTGHTFVPRPLEDPARLVAEAISLSLYSHRVVVRVAARAEVVARRVGPSVGTVRSDGKGAEVVIGADDFDWVAGYLIGLGLDFEVLEPSELRDHLARLGSRLSAAHQPR